MKISYFDLPNAHFVKSYNLGRKGVHQGARG